MNTGIGTYRYDVDFAGGGDMVLGFVYEICGCERGIEVYF